MQQPPEGDETRVSQPPSTGPWGAYPPPPGTPPLRAQPWGAGANPPAQRLTPMSIYPPPPEYYMWPAPGSASPGPISPGEGPWPPYVGAPAYPPSGLPPAPPPPPGYPAYWAPPNPHGGWGASAYPNYAPDGKVDPELLRQTEPGRRPSGGSGAAVGLGATVVAALTKLAVLAKFALPLLSALASFGVYAAIYGWQFGLGIVALLFVHEMGHVAVIRAKGLPASLPIFIPLMGALIFLRGMPHNARDEAEIAIGGPLAGALAGGACYMLYAQSGDHIWLALAFFSFFINLFNLIPVSPLDGGRIVGAISKWIWPLGLVILAIALFYTHSIILLIVGWLGLLQTISRFRGGAALDAYYGVPLATRVWITALYFGLAAVLALAILNLQPLLVNTGGFFGR